MAFQSWRIYIISICICCIYIAIYIAIYHSSLDLYSRLIWILKNPKTNPNKIIISEWILRYWACVGFAQRLTVTQHGVLLAKGEMSGLFCARHIRHIKEKKWKGRVLSCSQTASSYRHHVIRVTTSAALVFHVSDTDFSWSSGVFLAVIFLIVWAFSKITCHNEEINHRGTLAGKEVEGVMWYLHLRRQGHYVS